MAAADTKDLERKKIAQIELGKFLLDSVVWIQNNLSNF